MEQEDRKREEEEKAARRAQFREKAALFGKNWEKKVQVLKFSLIVYTRYFGFIALMPRK